jgi:hypothetical protein
VIANSEVRKKLVGIEQGEHAGRNPRITGQ